MHALPLLLALGCAATMAPAMLRALGAHTKANYRGRELPFPLGVLPLAAALLALGPLELTVRDTLRNCYDPEIPVHIVDLGLVYGIQIAPLPSGRSLVSVQMTLTAPG